MRLFLSLALVSVVLLQMVNAWNGINRQKVASTMTMKNMFNPLRSFTAGIAAAAILTQAPLVSLAELKPTPWNSAMQYEVITANDNGAVPKVGDLIAIRFKASFNGVTVDDTFKTADPYYFRCGVGTVVKGLDEAVTHMHEGERSLFRFGGELGFGQKGLPSAPGRPRVPPNAVLDYEVLLEKLPGTGEDFIVDE